MSTPLAQKIFIELLRSYHDGIGKTHAADPITEVAHYLAKDAYFMAMEYERTMEKLEGGDV